MARRRRRRRPPDRPPRHGERGRARARRAPPAPHGRHPRAGGQGLRARRRRRDRRRRVRARSRAVSGAVAAPRARRLRRRMARYVIKLGSGITADDAGALRADVLAAICDEVAARRRAGDDVVVVSSGAIARGLRHDGARRAAERDRGPAGRQRGGPGPALPRLRRAAAPHRGVTARPGAADVLRPQPPHALPQRAPDAAAAAGLGRRPDHQRERHDRDRRDLLRRQRLPRRAGRDPRRAPTGCSCSPASTGSTPPTRARDPSASIVPRDHRLRDAGATQTSIGDSTSPLGSGGMRSKVVAAEMATAAGIPAAIATACATRRWARSLAGETDEGTALPRRGRWASRRSSSGCSYAKPSHGHDRRRRGRGARAARGRHVAAAGRHRRRARPTSTPATPSHVRPRRPRARRQGHHELLLGRRAAPVMGLKSAQVREVLPRATEEAVHRDYFVLA